MISDEKWERIQDDTQPDCLEIIQHTLIHSHNIEEYASHDDLKFKYTHIERLKRERRRVDRRSTNTRLYERNEWLNCNMSLHEQDLWIKESDKAISQMEDSVGQIFVEENVHTEQVLDDTTYKRYVRMTLRD